MAEKCGCACQGGTNLVFACSGAADVGAISDLAARKMTKDGIGKMYCLAGIGGNVSGIIETTKAADQILAIDGCPVACTKKLLERNGFGNFKYIELSTLGFEKGKSPAEEKAVTKVFNKGKELLSVC
ncbi:MAG: zinc-binding protein [Spirochaetes bacterium GWF1_41_5]|nr:MAG: zinc-binding protein [Spirochaetes bacterium GWF1_41_5]HBE00974.1 zinc-binding protein [Spirochaetia bacterium]